MQFLYGKQFAQQVQHQVARRASGMRMKPTLAIILVGSDPASLNYVARKERAAHEAGCGFTLHRLRVGVSQKRIVSLIERLNKNTKVRGIIVQLPLPRKFNTEEVLSAIAPAKDVDNLRGDSSFVSPSVRAIWHILQKAGKPRKSAHILIVGYGRLIGKPLFAYLLEKGFTNIVVADKSTKNLSVLTSQAHIIISAVGKPGLISRVKKGAIIIDAGAGLKNGKIKGDVDVALVSKQAALLTPVPGGVGPLTVAYLFKNLVQLK